jgi:tetratricopeptide (TPR) repeat protein
MMSTQLDSTLDSYQKQIEDLRQPKRRIDSNEALAILSVRDDLQVALEEQKLVQLDLSQQVFDLDAVLRANATKIVDAINGKTNYRFTHWRENIQPNETAWWWRLDTIESPPPQEPFGWGWNGLTIVAWVFNIILLVNVASRFGGAGGVGFLDPIAVILPGIGAFLSAGGKLPKFEPLLKWLKIIPYPDRQLTKFLVTTILSVVLVFGSSAIPLVSDMFTGYGVENFNAGDLTAAEKDYKRAISLNGKNMDAHYNLGDVYEQWFEIDRAKKQYQIAAAEKLPQAYNNLGRLYIIEKKYPQAETLLATGLEQANRKDIAENIKYGLYKNLGWARLKQNRYPAAKEALQKAVAILGKRTDDTNIKNPGAAHCLLAQTLEQLKESTAMGEWEKCSQIELPKHRFDPDEDTWRYLAKQKLSKPQLPQVNNVKPPKVK